MKVTIHLYSQSQPVEITGVRNAYTKGPLYCALKYSGVVDKFPLEHIFRVREIPAEDEKAR